MGFFGELICIFIFIFLFENIKQVLTKDSVTVSVDAVVYYRVNNATISIANVENAHHSTRLLAQTTLRNTMGTRHLHEILSERMTISGSMQVIMYIHFLEFFHSSLSLSLSLLSSTHHYMNNIDFCLIFFLNPRVTINPHVVCLHTRVRSSTLFIFIFIYSYSKRVLHKRDKRKHFY
jgi:hypothetical protein